MLKEVPGRTSIIPFPHLATHFPPLNEIQFRCPNGVWPTEILGFSWQRRVKSNSKVGEGRPREGGARAVEAWVKEEISDAFEEGWVWERGEMAGRMEEADGEWSSAVSRDGGGRGMVVWFRDFLDFDERDKYEEQS